jgi:hypothetical protein
MPACYKVLAERHILKQSDSPLNWGDGHHQIEWLSDEKKVGVLSQHEKLKPRHFLAVEYARRFLKL